MPRWAPRIICGKQRSTFARETLPDDHHVETRVGDLGSGDDRHPTAVAVGVAHGHEPGVPFPLRVVGGDPHGGGLVGGHAS